MTTNASNPYKQLAITAFSGWLCLAQASIADSIDTEKSPLTLGYFQPKAIGAEFIGMPWITDLAIVDLDQDGLLDVVACEGRLSQVLWLRQISEEVYEETILDDSVAGPAHIEAVDIDFDGDFDLLVSGMGIVTPSNDRLGTVAILENNGNQGFTSRRVLENTSRVTYVGAGDLDGDGDLDLSVGQFGYFEGEIRWMENKGDWTFQSHPLLDLSGTIHAPIADIDSDGDLDITALVSQDWEEVHLFENNGKGRFTPRIVHGSTNKDFGSSGLTIADLDQDGDLDIVYTNGDGFDYGSYAARQWHGVQWLENIGEGQFTPHRIGDFPGAYSPLVVDIENDGDLDIVVVSGFNDWSSPEAKSLVCFENIGNETFVLRELSEAPTHLVVVDGADLDKDGKIELVTGAFHMYPPYEIFSKITLWNN